MSGEHGSSRRQFLAAAATGTVAGVAGCTNPLSSDEDGEGQLSVPSLSSFRGSGPLVEGRSAPGGTSIEELPDLSGQLNLYIGGGEGGIYLTFVEKLQEIYPDFSVSPHSAPSSSLAQTVVEEVEAGRSSADVFWSIDASSLGYVADNDAYEPLPDETVEPVPQGFRGDDNAWVGVAGRARSVPYNTDRLSESDVPGTVQEFPGASQLNDATGWAPTYGAFKSFVTAMRLLEGADATKSWLAGMVDAGVQRFPNEFVISQQVADGAISAGFANHYYAMRVKADRPDAPIDLAFTEGDAGALVNVAGTLLVQGTQREQLAADFVRHLLSAEAQEFFATVSYAYPMIPEVEPVGGLPTVDQLDPPEIDLAKLSDLEPTLDLMREAGVL